MMFPIMRGAASTARNRIGDITIVSVPWAAGERKMMRSRSLGRVFRGYCTIDGRAMSKQACS